MILTLDLGDNMVFKQTQVYNISYMFSSDCQTLLRKRAGIRGLCSSPVVMWTSVTISFKGEDLLPIQMSSSRTSLSPRPPVTEAFFPRILLLGWGWGEVSLNQDGRVYPCSKMSGGECFHTWMDNNNNLKVECAALSFY